MSENLHLIIMVKSKKGFNWKARSQISGSVDLSQAKLLEDKLENNGKQKSRTGGGFEVGIAFYLCGGHEHLICITLNILGKQCSGYAC